MSLHPPSLSGKVAIVTGAASGIGRATACLFAAHGARVVAADIHDTDAVVQAIEAAGGAAISCQVDVTRPDDCERLVVRTLAAYGRLDIAFNNAGLTGPVAKLEDLGQEAWRRVLDVNLTGVFNCMVSELRAMKQFGGGAMVNTASIAGLSGAAGAAAYSASKHGVIGLTRSAALELAPHGIRVNALCPGLVDTPMTQGEGSAFSRAHVSKTAQRSPMRRLSDPREQAEMVLWLCSSQSSFVTGAHFVVDGGLTA